jgi:hypothetical protein
LSLTRLAKLGALLLALAALGSSTLPVSTERLFAEAAASCHGTVRRVESFLDPASGFIRHAGVDQGA